jgi:predicted TIM-barrel fold metal-dependent hydrolase
MAQPGFIDSHIHVWPESGEAARPSRYTAEDHFAVARPAGVERTVLIQPGMFRFDNSYMLEAVRAFPGVFSAVAVVDADSEKLDDNVARLHGQGARGFRITARAGKPWSEWEGMHRLWRAAAAGKMAVCPLIDPEAFPWVAGMCVKHLETRVAIDHLGRVGASGQIADGDLRALCGLAKFPRVHVKVSAFYALGRKQAPYTDLAPMIRQVFETYGPRRLMWGSDAPYQAQPPHNYPAAVDLIRTGLPFLSEEDRTWLLRRTAESIFF